MGFRFGVWVLGFDRRFRRFRVRFGVWVWVWGLEGFQSLGFWVWGSVFGFEA